MTENRHSLGRIKFVQIQRSPMKIGTPGKDRTYRPDPLLVVDRLLLTENGIIGITEDDVHIADVHHADHPQTRFRGDNHISLGFTSHYKKMRSHFGDHMLDGIAAESIIVETSEVVLPSQIGKYIGIQNAETGNMTVLNEIIPAPPCVEFSHFAANRPLSSEETKQALQFLDKGIRGYYAALVKTNQDVSIQAGDLVFTSNSM